jgi:hypothetical protein
VLHQITLDERGRGTGLKGEGLEIFRVRAECLCGWVGGKWVFADKYNPQEHGMKSRASEMTLEDAAREEAEHAAVRHLWDFGFESSPVAGATWSEIRRAIEERQ